MRQRTSRPIRLAIVLSAGTALSLAGCGSDSGGGGGSTDAFCEEVTALAASDADTTEEQDLAALQAVAASAPGEISDEMNQLVEAFEELQAFDAEAASDDEMADFLALAASIEEVGTAVEAFATENCPDLPAEVFSTE
jgi:hypothetical protein